MGRSGSMERGDSVERGGSIGRGGASLITFFRRGGVGAWGGVGWEHHYLYF